MKTALILLALAATSALAATPDPTAAVLKRCQDDPINASTAGQTECEATAQRAYDLRMNAAYSALIKRLPADAGERLRQGQRAWLAFRDADARARAALYATRRGTMYAPMDAASATAVIRDRALQLESLLRVMAIDG